jgi:hypothetical protein
MRNGRGMGLRSAILAAALVAACSSGPSTATLTPGPGLPDAVAGAFSTFHEGGLVFSYPAAWRIFHHEMTSSFSRSIADLATVDVPEPCITTQDAVGTSTDCADRFHLEPDTLVVHVTGNGFPGFDILQRPADAKAIDVDGLPGYLQTGPSDEPMLGADRTWTWTLPSHGSVDNSYQLRAVVRGPDLDLMTSQLQALISTVRYDPPVARLPVTGAALDAALATTLGELAASSAAWRCFPAHVGSATGTISEFPGGPALLAAHDATCQTAVEATALQLWRATFTVTLDQADPDVGGRFQAQVWIAPGGMPGLMTSGSAAP